MGSNHTVFRIIFFLSNWRDFHFHEHIKLEISSKCDIKAENSSTLCKFHEGRKGLRPMGSDADRLRADILLIHCISTCPFGTYKATRKIPEVRCICQYRVRTRFWTKVSRTFQGHISHFLRTPFSAKKSLKSMSFLVLPQEQFYPEGLSVFTGLDKVKTKSQGFSRTDCNFQSRTWICILKFKDFQGACKPCQ